MEAVTAGVAGAGVGTGSKTIADLLPLAVEKYGDAPAQRHKSGDAWVDVPYSELGRAVREISLGLIGLGIEPGEKVAILSNTRPEWTNACFGILTSGAALVTIYQTNSAEECQYVLAHSDSRAVFVEDAAQLAKIREVRGDCPELRHVIVMEPGDTELSAGDGEQSTGGAARERRRPRRRRVEAALRGRHARRRVPLHLHLGHHRPTQGLPALARQLPRDHGRRDQGQRARGRRQRLPLPPAGARLRDPDPVHRLRAGRDARLLVRRPEADHPRPHRGQAELLPVGPADVREDLHARDQRGARPRAAREGDRPRREGAHGARGRRGGARRARDRVRPGRRGALQERARPVRRQHPRVRDRRRADRARRSCASSTPAACR